MKIFEIVQRNYATLGISSSHQSTQKYPFNKRELFGFILFACTTVLQYVGTFHDSSNFMEFMVSVCATSGGTLIFVFFLAIVFRKTTLFQSIEHIEKVIDSSESIRMQFQ